jgi:predicted nuclease of predicted toxin-antitoxin system
VRLLFDQNLSPRLVAILADLHGGSTHVRNEGLQRADDDAVWAYALRQGFVIVSKDADFHQRSFVLGHPPKAIWIQRGNCSTDEIAALPHRFARILERRLYERASGVVVLSERAKSIGTIKRHSRKPPLPLRVSRWLLPPAHRYRWPRAGLEDGW